MHNNTLMQKGSSKKSQISVGLTGDEKNRLTKQSFTQNRSVSQIMRFAIKTYLDGLETPSMQPIQVDSVEQLFTKLGTQLAKNADILNSLQMTLIEIHSKGPGQPLQFNYFSDNATTITGYDKFDLLDKEFFHSRIHGDDLSDNLIEQPEEKYWESGFRFKKAHGKFFHTRICFRVLTDRRIVASWQFLDEVT